MNPQASLLVQCGIPGLTVVVLALVVLGVRRVSGAGAMLRFGMAALAWLAFTGVLGASGFLADFESRPPHLLVVFLPTLAGTVLLGLSRFGTELARLPLPALIAFHGFRFPLELVMHRAASDGTMPVQMTFTGSNFDIATGITAVVVAALAARDRAPRWLLLAWNALGSALLITILGIAVASLPPFGLFGRKPEQLNTWVAYFPYVWLPAGLVSAAVLGHVLLWRRLLTHGMRGRALAPLV
ncbi:MAG TPA: hypothetical protein VHB79_35320 [Polyangiaceae bacterium]|nr:hypothetical protein [Polyangiaceae bacterium]